jgi:SET domain-containing protein
MLKVKKSGIPGAGRGLFTLRDIRKGDIVCEYEGERITWAECIRRNEAHPSKAAYFFYIHEHLCIDAEHAVHCPARFANDAAGPVRSPGVRNNARFEVRGDRVYIIASRWIRSGEEILVSYGRGYWKAMAIGK